MKYIDADNDTTTLPELILFSDLDGTLLDHDTYSHTPALGMLHFLDQQHIPLILATSKTLAELLPLREVMGNRHPFIVENGAAVYIPQGYFVNTDNSIVEQNGFLRLAFCPPRSHWQQLLAQAESEYPGCFVSFQELGDEGIADATGLSLPQAALANQREFSEPLLWLADEETRKAFIADMHNNGANVLQGGRFLHISGACNKGEALIWLKARFEAEYNAPFISIAAGDSANDIAMLDNADHALIVRSPIHAPPSLTRRDHVLLSETFGPEGWARGIEKILQTLELEKSTS